MGNGWESIKGYVDCENFEIIEWDEETQEIYNAVCTIHSPCFPTCDGCSSKAAYLPIDELDANDTLVAALKWWDEEATSLTTGEYGGHNVFDEDPEWVRTARKAIADAPKPVPITPAATPTSLLHTELVSLTQGDVDILNGSVNRKVRADVYEDGEVKRLYEIWRSL